MNDINIGDIVTLRGNKNRFFKVTDIKKTSSSDYYDVDEFKNENCIGVRYDFYKNVIERTFILYRKGKKNNYNLE